MAEQAEPRKKRGRPRIHEKRSSPYKKVGQGAPLRSQARELVCNVRKYFISEKENKGPLLPVDKAVDRAAAALCINKNTVVSICKEKTKNINEGRPTKLETPNKKRIIRRRVTRLDTFQQDAIRRHIYSYYSRKEHPTLNKLHVSLKEADLFRGSKSSLRNLICHIGFKYERINKRRILLERNDIVAKRCKFLRDIRKENFENIVWLDETWVNAGHCPNKGWSDGSTTGTIAAPIGKGERLILLHAGRSSGFVPGCCLLFKSGGTGDYHEEMDGVTFQKWFNDKLLPQLSNPTTIVMDNASYHSHLLEKVPNTSTKKAEMQAWLQRQDIVYEEYMTKAELLEIIKRNKPPNPTYVIDELAENAGHKVVRLPPYHCHFNSIELIWAQVKGYVARNNKLFTITETKRLTMEAIDRVSSAEWKKVVEHVKKVIDEAWDKEGIMEQDVEQMIINVTEGDEDDSDEESENEEGYCFVDDINQDIDVYEEEDDMDISLSGVFPLSPVQENVLDFTDY